MLARSRPAVRATMPPAVRGLGGGGDGARGAAGVVDAWALGGPPALIMVAGGAAVVGHWKSVFTGFRGGDGMAPLMGVALALIPALAVLGVAAGLGHGGDANTGEGPGERNEIKRQMREGTRKEAEEKLSMRIGGEAERQLFRTERGPRKWKPNDLGIIIVSCERGELRESPNGIYLYDDDGMRELKLDADSQNRDAELREMYNAVHLGKPVYHSGHWGMATLEVALAINESAKTHKDVILTHQVEMPAGYDEEYKVVVAEEVQISG